MLVVTMLCAATIMTGAVMAFGFSIWLIKIGLFAILGYIGNMMIHISTMQSHIKCMLSYAGDMDDSKKDMFEEDEDDEDWNK